MPPRRASPAKPRTRLAYERITRGFTQEQMVERTGIKLATYRRLERGALPSAQHPNPPIRFIVNCAIVLDCNWERLWEPSWNEWLDLGVGEPDDGDHDAWEWIAHEWPHPREDLLDPRPSFPDRDSNPQDSE
jgi:transcriptional regulator with XRE-family HTH domain